MNLFLLGVLLAVFLVDVLSISLICWIAALFYKAAKSIKAKRVLLLGKSLLFFFLFFVFICNIANIYLSNKTFARDSDKPTLEKALAYFAISIIIGLLINISAEIIHCKIKKIEGWKYLANTFYLMSDTFIVFIIGFGFSSPIFSGLGGGNLSEQLRFSAPVFLILGSLSAAIVSMRHLAKLHNVHFK